MLFRSEADPVKVSKPSGKKSATTHNLSLLQRERTLNFCELLFDLSLFFK
jgi:hypothetical protein